MEEKFEIAKREFAEAFIVAFSAKSIPACAELVLNIEDNKTLEIDYEHSDEEYRKALLTQSENFLNLKSKFIDEKNADVDSALSVANIEEVSAGDFELNTDFPASFIPAIYIAMKPRLVKRVYYQVNICIEDTLFVNGKIKFNNLLGTRMSETYWKK